MRIIAAALLILLGPPATLDGRARGFAQVVISNGGRPFAGDHRTLTTISPNGDGYRDALRLRVRLNESMTVRVVVTAPRSGAGNVFARTLRLRRGNHVVVWRPDASTPPRTYMVRISGRDTAGAVWRHEGRSPAKPLVVRVLGIEAAFERESYRRNSVATFVLESDDPSLVLRILRAGTAADGPRASPLYGEVVSEPVAIERLDRRDGPRRLRVWVGDWPSGLYFAELRAPDGRVGYAPFVVRPSALGEHRVAVVLPTYTWQAYNFRDADGDAFGDTWYAAKTNRVRLARPYLDRGVPPFFSRYDLNFLRWLARGERAGKDRAADFLADSDLAAIRSATSLERAYDLVIFPGHHEYVTRREYDLIRRFRNRGGRLMFLSANNFFWHVERRGRTVVRTRKWRDLKRPESALLGVQYIASDRGERQGPFVVRASRHNAWLLEGTGLRVGSTFGRFGIEIDCRTRASPRGTAVLAEIPNLFGRGRTAQMTFYETPHGARVFSAGAFTLAGSALREPVSQLLDNLWVRLTASRDLGVRSAHEATSQPDKAPEPARGSRTRCGGPR